MSPSEKSLWETEAMRWIPALLLTLPCAIAANQPAFVYTFAGMPYEFGIVALTVDAAGNTYLTGYTKGPIPVTPNAYQPQPTAGSGGTGSLVCTGPILSGVPVGPCDNAFL